MKSIIWLSTTKAMQGHIRAAAWWYRVHREKALVAHVLIIVVCYCNNHHTSGIIIMQTPTHKIYTEHVFSGFHLSNFSIGSLYLYLLKYKIPRWEGKMGAPTKMLIFGSKMGIILKKTNISAVEHVDSNETQIVSSCSWSTQFSVTKPYIVLVKASLKFQY